MRIAINSALRGTKQGYRQTGIHRYLTELIDGLNRIKQPDDTVMEMGTRFPKVSDSPMARIVWEQTALPVTLAARRADVFHGPISVVPWISNVPSVVTVHDLAFLKFAEQVTRGRRSWLIAATRISARKASRIIADSEHTRLDLLEWLKLPEERVITVPLATSPRIQKVSGTSLDVFQTKHKIERPYVLAVGTLEPRKNLTTLLRAFSRIKDDIPHDLVLVGPEGWLTGELKETLEELKLGDRIRLTGFVSDEELGAWYSGADLFTFPSYYEGFGFPIVEAQKCGAPVLASNTSSFPEVVGDAGVMISPSDGDAWAENIRDLLNDDGRRSELRELGFRNAERFSWDKTAQQTYDIYKEIAR